MKNHPAFLSSLFYIFFFFWGIQSTYSQESGYQINFKISGFEGDEMMLAYYYGDKQYVKDTARIQPNGWFLLEGDEPLEGGIYMAVLPPNNNYFEILVSEQNQQMSFETNSQNLIGDMQISGSKENEQFYEYLQYLSIKRSQVNELNQQIEQESVSPTQKAELQKELDAINQEVEKYQKGLINDSPTSLLSGIVRANMPLEGMPEFTGDQKEVEMDQYLWTKVHWFDNVDVTDERLLRTPILFGKIDRYIHNLTVQHPDSISVSLDEVLEKVKPSEEVFKFFLVNYLNEYAKSKTVGMDAVYVHLAQNYYKKGLAPWTDPDQLDKIVENGDKLEPLLIGKIAPDIIMETQDGSKQSLHDFESPYTILLFWRPDCGICKETIPGLVDFVNEYQDKGVTVFSVCTKLGDEVPLCWTGVEDLGMNVFFNTVDPYGRSRFLDAYDIRSTPQIYVLDKDKKILSKKIGVDQLSKVFDFILKEE